MQTTPEEPDQYAGLYCPECEYPLTGLPEARCPECGQAFDADELWRRRLPEPQPVYPWCERSTRGWIAAYAQTWAEVVFAPRKFARRFPNVPRLADVWSFALASRGVPLPILLAVLVIGRAEVPGFALMVVVWLCLVVASLACEFGIALVCEASCVESRPFPLARPQGWRGLMPFGSAFLPPLMILPLLAAPLAMAKPLLAALLSYSLMLYVFGHWLVCLCTMIAARSGRRGRVRAIVAGLLLGAFLGSFAGFVVLTWWYAVLSVVWGG